MTIEKRMKLSPHNQSGSKGIFKAISVAQAGTSANLSAGASSPCSVGKKALQSKLLCPLI
jgi:hypothetical protein